ncbi:hypothetical protein [Streptosporangium carneum]|uniref:hypothetical protein n=1 Tax=Streptosporangium carneum TaxID=47481 RepID=UPI0022F32C45|nr:hypothetical protein [Streptosporangium carneum]
MIDVTLNELNAVYGRRWSISAALGGGWCAVRRGDLSQESVRRGLSLVRCGQTLEELARHLAAEKRVEERWWIADAPCAGLDPAADAPPKQARRRG